MCPSKWQNLSVALLAQLIRNCGDFSLEWPYMIRRLVSGNYIPETFQSTVRAKSATNACRRSWFSSLLQFLESFCIILHSCKGISSWCFVFIITINSIEHVVFESSHQMMCWREPIVLLNLIIFDIFRLAMIHWFFAYLVTFSFCKVDHCFLCTSWRHA